MLKKLYSEFTGINTETDRIDTSQVAFLKLDNFIVNRVKKALVKRGGTQNITLPGDHWGIRGYVKDTTSPKLPLVDIPVLHRRNGTTSTIEKYDWATATFSPLPLGASTSFTTGDFLGSAQIDNLMVLCAGRPAKITDIDSGSVNRLGGPAPTAAPSIGTGAGSLSGIYSYFYTFYDPVSGWESSPGPVATTGTLASNNVTLSALETTAAREQVSFKRIYRTTTGPVLPYKYVTQVPLAQTSYVDNILDAALLQNAPDFGDHDPPPEPSYIAIAHENRIWIASDHHLYYSLPYTGNLYDLEYFSDDRRITFPHRITGLAAPRSGGLLVFNPPGFGIHEIVGRTESNFESVPRYKDEGTNYHSSIAITGDYVCFWGSTGPRILTPGGVIKNLDKQIANNYRELLEREYNTSSSIWCVWSEAYKQFIFGVSATHNEDSMWHETGTSLVVPWVDVITGQLVDWSVMTTAPTPPEPGDTTAPVISGVTAVNVQTTTVEIRWTTDEASDSQVEYGTTTSYGSSTTLNTSLVTNHAVVITGLSSGTLYHYRVKSRDAATNLATSGDFLVTTQSTGSATLLVYEDFSGGTPDAYWSGVVVDARNYSPNTAQLTYVTSPNRDSTHAAHYYVVSGTDERVPFQLDKGFASPIDELYISWYEYYVSGYPFPAGQKMFRLGFYDEGIPASRKEFNFWNQNGNTNLQVPWALGVWGNSTYGQVDDARNFGFGIPNMDTWVHFEVWTKLNTPSSSDGFIKCWMDGTQIGNFTALNMRNNDPLGWNFMFLGGNHSHQGPSPGNGSRYIDEIRMYNTKPGG